MSQIAVTDGALMHISKDGKCIYCGSKHKICIVCKKGFKGGNNNNLICSARCRTRKHRQKIRDELELDDE